jgi:hypothetical protein
MRLQFLDFAEKLLLAVCEQQPPDFSGLGVVFYESLEELDFIPLETPTSALTLAPVIGLPAIAKTLACVSSRDSGCHDGFHLIDIKNERLTHLAQFLSPPLPPFGQTPLKAKGARHMAALLSTRVKGIAGVGILGQNREMTIYSNGSLAFRGPPT